MHRTMHTACGGQHGLLTYLGSPLNCIEYWTISICIIIIITIFTCAHLVFDIFNSGMMKKHILRINSLHGERHKCRLSSNSRLPQMSTLL